LQQTRPQDAQLPAHVTWLLEHRTGHRWAPDKATGPAALALCRWFAMVKQRRKDWWLSYL
jgi:hypothetical protein